MNPTTQDNESYSIDACDEAFVRDFMPYKGRPEPLAVWRAAWESATKHFASAGVGEPVARVIADDEKAAVDVGFVDWIGGRALKYGTLLYTTSRAAHGASDLGVAATLPGSTLQPPAAASASIPNADARDAARLHWLHSPASNNVDGYEWGIYRVKWVNGRASEVWQTNADFSDLDAAMGGQ